MLTFPRLDQHNNPTILKLTPNLIPVFTKVLSPPLEQLDDETREKVKQTVDFLAKQHPELVRGNEALLAVLQD